MSVPYTLIPGKCISFFHNGKPKNYDASHPNFQDICVAVSAEDHSALDQLIDVKQVIARITEGNVVISTNDEVYYKNQLVPEYLALRILDHVKNDIPINSICAFAEKLMQNPNESVRNDLYKWLEVGKMPIYPDGDFVAYKLVKSDFTPHHKGPYGQDQSVGTLVEMPREKCDENRGITCSTGLHFCSYEYLPQFHEMNGSVKGDVVIVLKINPTDVVAIPTDYNNTKGRTCRFFVTGTIDSATIKETFGDKLVVADFGLVKKGKVAKSKVKKAKKVEFCNSNGEIFTPKEIQKTFKRNNSNKTNTAAALDISRSTLNRWLKKIGE